MKRILLLLCFVIFTSFFYNHSLAQVMKQDNSSVYIGSYNIYTFGKHEKTQVYNAAKVLSSGDFDLVAIQEVMDDEGQKAIDDLIVILNDSFKLQYKAVISSNIGAGLGGKERIAFIYKPDVLRLVPYNGTEIQLVDVPNKGRDFAFTHWTKGDFTFVLGSGHLYYGTGSKETILMRRKAELELVYSFYKDPIKLFGDEDLIFVGDFNRAAQVDDYKSIAYDTTKYFIPNVEFFDPTLNKFPQVKKENIIGKGIPRDDPKMLSTTVSKNNNYVYDMMICSISLLDNFEAPRNNGKFNNNFGVISYDTIDGIGYIPDVSKSRSTEEFKSLYSDHRPVWIRIGVN